MFSRHAPSAARPPLQAKAILPYISIRVGIIAAMTERDMQKAALRGEPSYVWRAGQQRRLDMIAQAAGNRIGGLVLENGCGVGMYVEKLTSLGSRVIGEQLAIEIVQKYLSAEFNGEERHVRRLAKLNAIEASHGSA